MGLKFHIFTCSLLSTFEGHRKMLYTSKYFATLIVVRSWDIPT